MRIDMKVASLEEKNAILALRLFDAVTGEQLKDVEAFDSETGWRREFVFEHAPSFKFQCMREITAPLRMEWPNGQMPEIFAAA